MTTRLILIRHAKPQADGTGDPTLSDDGRRIQSEMAHRLNATPHHILHSPLRRAQETAEIIANSLGGELSCEPALGVPFDEAPLLSRIVPGHTNVMVGHDPTLASFGNHLLGRLYLPSGMAKSGALILEFPGAIDFGQATLIDYLCP